MGEVSDEGSRRTDAVISSGWKRPTSATVATALAVAVAAAAGGRLLAPKAAASSPAFGAARRIELGHVLNLHDFQLAAEQRLAPSPYGYYATGATDEVTRDANAAAFGRAWLRPRVLRDVAEVNLSCRILGTPSSLPVFISPTAMAGLAHEDAEPAIARAAGAHGLIQIISQSSSRKLESITSARQENQVQWFQLYVRENRSASEAVIRRAVEAGCKALVLTVDSPVLGMREAWLRTHVTEDEEQNRQWFKSAYMGADPRLSWDDLPWLRSIAQVPLVLKGVQTGEDAVLAARHSVDAILVSNHGGRNLDTARPTLDVLAEVMTALDAAGLRERIEVYLDGGVRRGTDVYKALALGARAVGIGRPVAFSLVFGQKGVEKCLQLLRTELDLTMKSMGVRSLSEISARDVVFQPIAAAWGGA